ncbi:uncharacterized protein BYT42DRAFT_568478 [Radiomyces spectabilis]|uniref:uncharacterized protein n=1 Tax=Radiomyces spectabilis TaxID=64574 RepID=UPI00221FD497|nr:uncharacterized protein BYT42DRAFT_568478 [Radiomyces spectabilis]KAI8379342.1 hypothetical protein BYT42DRAFT_568478 [Radiomyces spectabilis]
MMDPLRCSIIVLYQPKPRPFLVEGYTDDTLEDDSPSYLGQLRQVFGQVIIQHSIADIPQYIHACSPSILLIDLDTIDPRAIPPHHQYHNHHNEHSSLYNACSLDCTLDTTDPRIAWIKYLSTKFITSNATIVVCSSNQDPNFMLHCIHAGAADYLLQPLRIDVIKTLFLKLHRIAHDINPPSSLSSSSSPTVASPTQPFAVHTVPSTVNLSTLWDGLHHRVQEIFIKDNHQQLSKSPCLNTYNTHARSSKYHTLTVDQTNYLKTRISSWDFSPFDLDHADLIHCVCLIFDQVLRFPELSHLKMSQAQLYDFIDELSSVYHDANPYHNFAHAVDVLQCSYFFLCKLGLVSFADRHVELASVTGHNMTRPQDLLRPKDIFALLIAAIGHDAAHPGVNNMFLINSATPLALLYNDRSVLESFHSMTLFQIIKKHGLDQYAGGTGAADYQEFRKTVVTTILATDMSLHNEYVTKIKDQAVRLKNCDFHSLEEPAKMEERLLICSAIIKCADISNVTRPFTRAAKWAELLCEEFACQGDLERELGLPVLPTNDRNKVVLEDSQIGFIRFVAVNLFESVREVMTDMNFALEYMQSNLKRWENRKNATHDSGVSTLGDIESSTSRTDDKRTSTSSQSVDYHSHAGVDNLQLRLSVDTTRSESVFNQQFPSMPAVAMTNYGGHSLRPHQSSSSTPYLIHDTSSTPPPPQWTTHDGAGPVYCQCTIQ